MTMFQTLGRMLKGGMTLKARYEDCGHAAQMDGSDALKVFGGWARPSHVRRRLKCRECGGKRVTAWI